MASIYKRPDSGIYWLSCYPRQGDRLVRVSLGTSDKEEAERMCQKVELLVAMERMGEVALPAALLSHFNAAPVVVSTTNDPVVVNGRTVAHTTRVNGNVKEALRAYLVRCATTNVPSALNDKIYRLRKFFGSKLVAEVDPRPPEHLHYARKGVVEPWFKGTSLAEITPDTILSFFIDKNYARSNKRHFREVIHGLFRNALVNGLYKPVNPYAANPADELPSFGGKDSAITVLTADDVRQQLEVVSGNSQILFGCRLMIEAGFRLHEILSLRKRHIAPDLGKISLTMPKKENHLATGLKTGERPVTVRDVLKPYIVEYLADLKTDWLFTSPKGSRMTTHDFGEALHKLNHAAHLSWTTQDFRHTFATNRIAEGWNLKTLADEMGTSIQMLMLHYAAYIAPPVQAAVSSVHGAK
jgi:integrase